jgi:hypothetical protein
VRFLRAKGPIVKHIHKKMFPVYGGKCSSHKAVHVRGKSFAVEEEVETEVWK